MKIELLGDVKHALESTAKALTEAGLNVEINSFPYDGATVIVAVSSLYGLSTASLSALESWNGKKVHLIGILLTEVQPIPNEDSLGLAFYETMSQMFPAYIEGLMFDPKDRVPEFRSNAHDLAQQIHDSARGNPRNGSSRSIIMQVDKKNFQTYMAMFNKKPWWKFW